MEATALLIIDVQRGIIEIPVHDAEGLLARLADLMARARAAEVPVISIQHEDQELQRGTPGWEIHPAVAPQPGEALMAKTECDSFYNTDLAQRLAEMCVSHLIIGGCQTDWCVQTTVRRALDLGYRVTLVSDGHSTCDSEGRTGLEIITATNRDLTEYGAKPRRAAEVKFV